MIHNDGMAETTEFNNLRENLITQIRKRDGRIVDFGKSKISNAIYKALVATGKPDYHLAETLTDKVIEKMVQHGYTSTEISAIPSVEDVQDIVESILIEEGLSDTAKSYILYRHERRKILEERMNLNVNGVDKAFNVNSLLLLRDKNNKIDQEMVLRC
jgi:ribonucleoside-diphosphate reductase alpha chain